MSEHPTLSGSIFSNEKDPRKIENLVRVFLNIAHRKSDEIGLFLTGLCDIHLPHKVFEAAQLLQAAQFAARCKTNLTVTYVPSLDNDQEVVIRWDRRSDADRTDDGHSARFAFLKYHFWYFQGKQKCILSLHWNAGEVADSEKGSYFFSECGLNALLGLPPHPGNE